MGICDGNLETAEPANYYRNKTQEYHCKSEIYAVTFVRAYDFAKKIQNH
jgi:hypothetical protein